MPTRSPKIQVRTYNFGSRETTPSVRSVSVWDTPWRASRYGASMDIDERLQDYAEEVTSPHEPWLAALSEETHRTLGSGDDAHRPRRRDGCSSCSCGRRSRNACSRSARSAATRRSRWPRASHADGHIDTLELDPKRAAVAQSHIDRSPWAHQITIHIGPAGESIAALPGSFDFVFMDADKTGYIDYYEAVLPRLTERGLIVADNTLHGGHVFDDGDTDRRLQRACRRRPAQRRRCC